MFTIWGKSSSAHCDGLTRRDFLQIGSLGATGLSLTDVLRARAAPGGERRFQSVILFWLDGGLSHLESYDPKPEAPSGYRSLFGLTDTRVPGIRICDLLPGHARLMDRLAIVRSVTHSCGEHWSGPHAMLTGHCGPTFDNPAQTHPSGASVVARFVESRRPGLPPYVAVPFAFHSFQRMVPGYHSASYLGARHNPFSLVEARQTYQLTGEELRARDLTLPTDVHQDRLSDRQALWQSLDVLRRAVDVPVVGDSMSVHAHQAFELTLSPAARKAFALDTVDPRMRDRYGRNYLGQSALLARQLVEAGVTFVTVCHRDWDHHEKIEPGLRTMLPQLDRAVASVVQDLDERGLLGEVLVVVMGEFGRTPRVNANAGRDHWAPAASVLLAGRNVRAGQVIGSTTAKGERPADRPVAPADLWATVYHLLGIDRLRQVPNTAGRPVPISTGEVIRELV